MRYIKDLREGDSLKEVFFCKQFNQLKTKVGKTYYAITLQDKTGTLDAKVWDLGPGIEHFEALDFIHVEGTITSYQGALQLNVSRLFKASEGSYDPTDYMPSTEKDVKAMFAELMSYIEKVKEPHLAELLKSLFVEDKEFIKEFVKRSAAKTVHHSFMGGLLEHTLSVTQNCDYFADHYPMLNRDLLLTAAICHDIGKVEEISDFPANDYTDEGNLIGHIVVGAEMVSERIKKIPGFPKVLGQELRHCVLAHHGELEFGSPKKPAIAEAFALNFADAVDAKMDTLKELFSGYDDKTTWLGFQKFLDGNIRKT